VIISIGYIVGCYSEEGMILREEERNTKIYFGEITDQDHLYDIMMPPRSEVIKSLSVSCRRDHDITGYRVLLVIS